MVRKSFRLLAGALLPRGNGRKLAAAALVVVLAGCGAPASKPVAEQQVAGDGFGFRAPAGWLVVHGPRSVQARAGDALVSVMIFRLARPYRPALWRKVVSELDRVAAELARRERGKVTASATRQIAGGDARVYEIARSGGSNERIAFVLRGRREYELFCREPDAAAHAACDRLLGSFSLA